MNTKKIFLEILKRARRPLDSLKQVEILEEWKFDLKIKVWFLRISISIDCDESCFLHKTQWYIVVENNYPKGEIKIYPDVENSLNKTLYHQSNNSKIEENGLWRKGALCLEVNTLFRFQFEPFNIDERLLYHVKRAINWIELASNKKLVSAEEPFELPVFRVTSFSKIQFAFSEDVVSYMQWDSTDCSYGISELGVYKKEPSIFYVKTFKSIDNNIINITEWGKYLSTDNISSPVNAIWIKLKKILLIEEWQTPETFGELVESCNKQNIDIMDILSKIFIKIRDGRRHLLLIGFPIPKTFGGESEIMYWQAIYLPVLSYGSNTARGFRCNQLGWWMRDRYKLLSNKTRIEWIFSENWNQKEISQRGRINNMLQRKKVLMLGVGCVGSSIAEILVRAGIYNLTIADSDILKIGNLMRHTLNLNNIGESKEVSLCNYLNLLNPHANVNVISKKININENNECNIDLTKYEIIIDCTGVNDVLEFIEKISLKENCLFASVSVSFGSKSLFLTMANSKYFNADNFLEFIHPYIQKEKSLSNTYTLPRDGIGCWHPTFPGRSDDIWLAASTSVKAIENYVTMKNNKQISLVYEQRNKDGIFEGFVLVNKKEHE